MPVFPQLIVNVEAAQTLDVNEEPAIRDAVGEAEAVLGKRGRVVLRASGTEPVIRVMVEGEDEETVSSVAHRLADSVRSRIDSMAAAP